MDAVPVITDELRALGRALGAAGAAFFANPCPETRVTYAIAKRRELEAVYAGRPAAIRLLEEIFEQMLDDVEARATARRRE